MGHTTQAPAEIATQTLGTSDWPQGVAFVSVVAVTLHEGLLPVSFLLSLPYPWRALGVDPWI